MPFGNLGRGFGRLGGLEKGDFAPPLGYVFLLDLDGSYLTDTDGAYLIEAQ